jgi:intracellular multiplication protein IcmV
MAIKDIFKVNRKTFIDPKSWLDYDMVKDQTKTVASIFKATFSTRPPVAQTESFEQAKKRLRLTEEDIEETEKNYYFFAMLFLAVGVVLLGMGIYLLIDGVFGGFLLAVAIAAVVFAQAFRNHFYYFQMKHRKLGCTFSEWRSGRPNNEGSSK